MTKGNEHIWVLATHQDGKFSDVTFEMLADARALADKLKEKVMVLVLGADGISDGTKQLAEHGADEVYVGCQSEYAIYQTEVFVYTLEKICIDYKPSNIIIPATANGRDLAARLSARLNVGLISNCLKFQTGRDGIVQGFKETYGKKAYALMACCGARPHMFTFKPGVVGVGKPNKRRTAKEIKLEPFRQLQAKQVGRVLEQIPANPKTVDLSEADMVVAGGSGAGTKEKFGLIEELGDVLGAAVGGTRPAVDYDWIPFKRQIGQTGKIISPRLYVAAGISGASLHTMGVKDSETIIVINTDQNAEMFKLAHMGGVGDLGEVLPILIQKIKKHYDGLAR